MRRIIHIEADAPLKPPEGKPCNGCGVCCLAAPCPVGMLVSRRTRGPCAALRWSDAQRRYRCGLLGTPKAASPRSMLHRVGSAWARRMISAGSGCDSSLAVDDHAPAP